MKHGKKLYEGKAKILYATKDPKLIIQYFKDDATAFNAQKKGTIINKGIMNNAISTVLFEYLAKNGVKTHFVERLSEREMLCKRLDIVLIETVARNIIAGSLSKRTGLSEGIVLKKPIVEFYYKDDDLGDPLLTRDHVKILKLANDKQMDKLREYAFECNRLLKSFFKRKNLDLVDIKFEFGHHGRQLLLGDEICPDTCRLWDRTTSEKMDKDRFRRDLGGVEEAYAEVTRRVLSGAKSKHPIDWDTLAAGGTA